MQRKTSKITQYYIFQKASGDTLKGNNYTKINKKAKIEFQHVQTRFISNVYFF